MPTKPAAATQMSCCRRVKIEGGLSFLHSDAPTVAAICWSVILNACGAPADWPATPKELVGELGE